jgi:hypothetical protein
MFLVTLFNMNPPAVEMECFALLLRSRGFSAQYDQLFRLKLLLIFLILSN